MSASISKYSCLQQQNHYSPDDIIVQVKEVSFVMSHYVYMTASVSEIFIQLYYVYNVKANVGKLYD